MKKLLLSLLVIMTLIFAFSGCSTTEEASQATTSATQQTTSATKSTTEPTQTTAQPTTQPTVQPTSDKIQTEQSSQSNEEYKSDEPEQNEQSNNSGSKTTDSNYSNSTPKYEDEESEEKGDDENMFYIYVNGSTLAAQFADNSSADAFRELLRNGDLTVSMDDYGSFEKVGSIGTSIVQNNEQITTEAGDIILYQGNKVTIYYDTNSWNFTRLGKVTNASQSELKNILGNGSVVATFSLYN